MNKLVDKNPILRFKLGRKIIKALSGIKVIATVDGRKFETTIELARRNGWEYYIPSKLALFNRNHPYGEVVEIPRKFAEPYTIRENPNFPASIQDFTYGDLLGSWRGVSSNQLSGLVRDLEDGNFAWHPKEIEVPYVPSDSLKKVGETLQATATSSPKPKYWWIKGFRNRVQGLGLKSRDDVKAILRKLGVKADGIWGKNTEAAYVNKFKFNPDTSEEIIPMQEILPVSVISNVTPTFNTLNNPNFNWREALKLHYLNPFVTSAKQGGQLISKNPVESLNNINKN